MNVTDKPLLVVVDDEPFFLTTIEKLLESQYRVLTASNSSEGLNLIRKEKPDLVLLDVEMPGIDGFELCEQLKTDASEAIRSIPVIFVTGLESDSDEETCFAVGGDDYISKPFKSSVVKARIARSLQLNLYVEFLEALLRIKSDSLESLQRQVKQALGPKDNLPDT